MSDIKNKVIAQATRLLDACGCEYIIKDYDGNIVSRGSLTLAPEPVVRKRHNTVVRGTYAAVYKEQIDKLNVGDVWTYPVPVGTSLVSFRAAASSYAADKFGKGNVMSSVCRGVLEILRVQ